MNTKKILLASFYGNIPEYVYSEYALLGTLQNTEHELHVLQTGPAARFYPGMETLLIDPTSTEVTVHHKNLQTFEATLRKAYPDFNYHYFGDFISDDEVFEIDKYIEEIELCQNLSNYNEILFKGVELGRFSIFRALRKQRIDSLEQIDAETGSIFRLSLRAGAMCIVAAQNLSQKLQVDVLFISQDFYTCSRAFINALKQLQNIKVLPLMNGPTVGKNLEHVTVAELFDSGWRERNLRNWRKVENVPQVDYSLIRMHFENLFLGRTAFGHDSISLEQGAGVYEILNLDPSKKLVVVALSGLDEVFATEMTWGEWNFKCLFEGQIEWVKALVEYFSIRPEVNLVIRMHPRSVSSVNEKESGFLELMKEMSKEFPENIRLNTPDDNISNYELMKFCHLILTYFSSAALEYGLFGIKSLTCVKNYDYAPYEILGKIPEDKEEYFGLLTTYLELPYVLDIDRIRKTFRWYKYHMDSQTIDLSSIVRFKKHVWLDKVVRLQRGVQNYLHALGVCGPYNPIWHRPKSKSKDAHFVKEIVETDEDLTAIKVKSTKAYSEDLEWNEIRNILDFLTRKLFGISPGLKIKYKNALSHEDVRSGLVIELDKGFGRIERVKVDSKQILLINLMKLIYQKYESDSKLLLNVD